MPLFPLFLRVVFSYIYMLALVRLSGKRDIGAISALDFLTALIIGDLFDDIFWTEVPTVYGFAAMSIIILLHMLVSFGAANSSKLRALFEGRSTLVVRGGQWVRRGLRSERVTTGEIEFMLRLRGVEDLSEVREALLEPSGELSVRLAPEAQPLSRRHLEQAAAS